MSIATGYDKWLGKYDIIRHQVNISSDVENCILNELEPTLMNIKATSIESSIMLAYYAANNIERDM